MVNIVKSNGMLNDIFEFFIEVFILLQILLFGICIKIIICLKLILIQDNLSLIINVKVLKIFILILLKLIDLSKIKLK